MITSSSGFPTCILQPCLKKSLGVLWVLLFACIHNTSAQKADSLIATLSQAGEDTAKVKTFIEICRQQGDITDLERVQYAQSALILSEKLNYHVGTIASNLALGAANNNLGKYDEALDYLDTALGLALKSSDKSMIARIYNSIGSAHLSKGDHALALSFFLKSLALYEELKKVKEEADITYNLSLVYYQVSDYDKASEYTARARVAYKNLKDTLSIALTETQLANIAYEQYQYDTALDYYKSALAITENLEDQTYAHVSLNGIGAVLFETNDYDQALVYHRRALETAKKIGDDNLIATSLMNLGREYAFVNKFRESEKLLKESIDLSKKIGAKPVTCDSYSYLSETYEMKGDFKNALEYSWLYMELKDSIFNEGNAAQINSLSAKYESEKKEKEIALLNADLLVKQQNQELLDAKVKEQNAVIISIGCGALLLFISAFLLYSRQKLRQKNKFQAELSEQQKNTATAVIQMQENERNRIARELHDGIGTYLSTLKTNLQVLESKVADEELLPFKNNTEIIDKTSTELRKITQGLSNEALQENGLAYALHELTESVNASGIMRLKLLTHGIEQRLAPLLETNFYRIAQELINNCIKHSKATQVTLQLIDHESLVLLMLEDNGIGFEENSQNSGMGLKNIRSRINFLSGTFKMESVLKKGSTFIVEVPKNKPQPFQK